MAKASGLGRMTISRIWRAFGLQPHGSESFKWSPDPLLIERVRDIVGLYMNPTTAHGTNLRHEPMGRETSSPWCK
jgi:hypothetical protein